MKKGDASVYAEMGRSRNVPVDQGQNKPKIRKDKQRGEYYQCWRFDGPKKDKNTNSVLLPDDVVNDIKRINLQQLVEFLLKNRWRDCLLSQSGYQALIG